ncbi:GNAT family N-acetyltransferase [Dermacoccaceae bacterium W4C1]
MSTGEIDLVQPEPISRHDALVAAGGGDPYFRFDALLKPGEVAYRHGGAITMRLVPHYSVRPPRFAVIGGSDTEAQELLGWVASTEPFGELSSVKVERHREATLHACFRVGDGGDWDWMWTTTAPAATDPERQVVTLDDDRDAPELLRLNEIGNPSAESEPGTGKTDRWAGIRVAGAIVAAAALHRSDTGHGMITGVVTHPAYRGHGYGRAVTAALTRRCVQADGVAALGMYAENDVARTLYTSMGYQVAHRFASRMIQPLPGHDGTPPSAPHAQG